MSPLLVLGPLAGTSLLAPFVRALPASLAPIVVAPDALPVRGAFPSTRALAHAVLDRVMPARAHVFGLSLGGMIAQWIAIDSPERVDRLVLASTTARGRVLLRAFAPRALTLARCLLARREDAPACLAGVVVSERARSDRLLVSPEGGRIPARRALLRLALAGVRHDAEAHLAKIVAPTLVLSALGDRVAPIAEQAALAAGIAHARHERVARTGHDLVIEQPERCARRVAAFLREREP